MKFFGGFIFVVLIIIFPLLSQLKAHQSVDEDKFKHYKIKAFAFFFKGIQGKSVGKYGIILPMLIVQLQGYIVGILTLCVMIICEVYKITENYVTIVGIIFIIHVISVILIIEITGQITKKRKIIICENYFIYSSLLFTKTVDYKDLKLSFKKENMYIFKDNKKILRINMFVDNSKYLKHKIIEINGRDCIIAGNKYS